MTDDIETGVDSFGQPVAPTEVPTPGETPEGERSAFSGDASYVESAEPAFDAADVFNTLPPDLHLSRHGEAIVTSFAEHMHSHAMSSSQVHESLRWVNGFDPGESDDTAIFEDFAMHMSKHGLTRTQVDEVKRWADAYVASEDYGDDMAVAECEAALAAIKGIMGTPAYIKDEQMQANYRTLVSVLAGEE